jgi:hypothetical protein
MFHLQCINQVHNIQITNKKHFKVYGVLYSQFSHQHVSAAIAAIFRVLFFFFNRHYNPGWVSACSTVVEHFQQEGFRECRCQRHVKPPTWRRIRDLERSNFRHKRPPASEATLANPAAEVGTMDEKWPRNFVESGDFHVTFGFFYMP